MSNTTVSERRWRGILREHRAGGLSVAAFCRRKRVSQASFYAWQRRLREATSFVEVKLPSETAAGAGVIELRLPGDRCVVIRPGFDRRTLLDLLATLEAGVVESGARMAFASGFAPREVVA